MSNPRAAVKPDASPAGGAPQRGRRSPAPDGCPVKGPIGDDKECTVWF